MMKKLLLATLCAFAFNFAVAKPYVSHNLPDSVLNPKHGYFDYDKAVAIIKDLEQHAGDYPVKFDTKADQELARKEVAILAQMFEFLLSDNIITSKDAHYFDTVLLTARLGWIAHNLDVENAAMLAEKYYQQAIKIAPANQKARVQYLYGNFLGSSAQTDRAITMLEQALKGGYRYANKSLGLAHLTKGNQKQALQYFKAYIKEFPQDKQALEILQAIEQGKIEVKTAR